MNHDRHQTFYASASKISVVDIYGSWYASKERGGKKRMNRSATEVAAVVR
jgi:hypothetical protein